MASKVSIHAPVIGANIDECEQEKRDKVSIHAPVIGANHQHGTAISCQRFNPRTCDRCEDSVAEHCFNFGVSIHAPVIGANTPCHAHAAHASFNPRTCDRCENGQHKTQRNT